MDSSPHSGPDVALIQEALEYQEEHSLEGPLFPEAQEELRRLVEQYQASQESGVSLAAQVLDLHDVLKGFLHDADTGEIPGRGLRGRARAIVYGSNPAKRPDDG